MPPPIDFLAYRFLHEPDPASANTEATRQIHFLRFAPIPLPEFHDFEGEYEDTFSRKAPDAYVKVASASGFPCVIFEVGWAESMEDLMADARLWLLGTGGQTKVVIIVTFTEDEHSHLSDSFPAPSSSTTDIAAENSTDADDPPEPTEEDLLLSSVDATTSPRALATAPPDAHRRGALAKPLLGRIAATFHDFRRTPTDIIYEDFTTTVLPTPKANEPQSYALTLTDLYGDNPLPAGEDPRRGFVMDMHVFRRDIAYQVPSMESKRSCDRAQDILKKRGLRVGKATFAGAKKAKRKRGDDGNANADYKEKRGEVRVV